MYYAICPDCKTVIRTNVRGLIWAGCPTCPFYGQVSVQAYPQAYPPITPPPPAPPLKFDALQPASQVATTAQRNRQVASLDISAFADEVYETLLALLMRTHPLPTLPVAWERLQVALDTLHTALGGSHMGEYAPDLDAVGDAIIAVTVAQLVALEAAGRLYAAAADDRSGQ